MSAVIEFPPNRIGIGSKRGGAPAFNAEVIIFPGVRFERGAEAADAKPARRASLAGPKEAESL